MKDVALYQPGCDGDGPYGCDYANDYPARLSKKGGLKVIGGRGMQQAVATHDETNSPRYTDPVEVSATGNNGTPSLIDALTRP